MNIRSKHDDGRIGWAENGPFDAIIVTAAAPALVDALTAQLAPGGNAGRAGGRRVLAIADEAAQGRRRPDHPGRRWRRSCSCRCSPG